MKRELCSRFFREKTMIKNINWYPGHMKKTRELIESHLKLVDVAVEICDARIPRSSRNPILSELIASKERVLILNKSDLADEETTKSWLDNIRKSEINNIRTVLPLNSMSGQGVNSLVNKLEKIASDKAAANPSKAQKPLRLMIIGVPNSGKSSLINRLTGRKAAQTGDRPGVTRGKQWLTLENGIQLLDTPGILWPKFEDPNVGLNLAFCGSIRDEIMDLSELGLELIKVLNADYHDLLDDRYSLHKIEHDEDDNRFSYESTLDENLMIMEKIAIARGFFLSGKRIDYERTARTLLDEFRAGKLGRISLEKPDDCI